MFKIYKYIIIYVLDLVYFINAVRENAFSQFYAIQEGEK